MSLSRSSYQSGGYSGIANNYQTYNRPGLDGRYDYPIGNVGYGPYPPSYTQTRQFRREEKKGLRQAKKEERADRKAAKNGTRSSYGPEYRSSYAPATNSYYPAATRSSYGSNYGTTYAPNSVGYLDPAGLQHISIEPCPCTQADFMGQSHVHSQVPVQQMIQPVYQQAPQTRAAQPIFDQSIYQSYAPYNYNNSAIAFDQSPRLALQRMGGSYGLIAPGTTPYQPAFSSINPIDWRRTSGL